MRHSLFIRLWWGFQNAKKKQLRAKKRMQKQQMQTHLQKQAHTKRLHAKVLVYCCSCGNAIPPDANFCWKCGHPTNQKKS